MKTLIKVVLVAILLWQFVLSFDEAIEYENEKAAQLGATYTQMKSIHVTE